MMSKEDQEALNHPIWYALHTNHAHFAQGSDLAKRYPADVSPLAAVKDQTPQAYSALGELLAPDEFAIFFLDAPPNVPKGWRLLKHFQMHHMICRDLPSPSKLESLIQPLHTDDVSHMQKIAEATEPGPFRTRTIEFGGYRAIRDAGHLAAMTGQRISLTGYTEVSAVCTYPEYRGRGYAQALVATVARGIFDHGETPILGVTIGNDAAVSTYEKVGFTIRRNLHVVVVKKPL
ncbi:GNAT family N-acetyltransferase [Acidobacterium sp. S8]|uniref:GNAT family N-acetyltransferase n=1 Tax=Acidobacterium sp. S8 TaxID=1641854 RepID=UPI00131D8675|nr:GNAT family N-acetyltransferase [Acidobacterium sp. S8]